MKQFCQFSGLILQRSTYLQNLGLPLTKLLIPSRELVFSYSIFDIIHLAAHKPFEKLTTTQRYLLTVAVLHATGIVKIKFPFSPEILTDEKIKAFWPTLMECAIRIATNWNRWKGLVADGHVATIEQRADTAETINWSVFVKEILLPATSLLLFKHKQITESDKLNWEIELEHALRTTLLEHRHIRAKYQFTPNMGKAVLREVNVTLAREDKPTLTPQYLEQCLHVFVNKPEKQKVGVHFIRHLRELIYLHAKISEDAEDTILRSQVALTLGYLDALLDYFADLSYLFGDGKVVNTPAKLPSASPVSYTVRTVVPVTSFPESTVVLPVKNSNVAASANPVIQRLLAKKLAEVEQTQTTVTATATTAEAPNG